MVALGLLYPRVYKTVDLKTSLVHVMKVKFSEIDCLIQATIIRKVAISSRMLVNYVKIGGIDNTGMDGLLEIT